jgi:hypothetical protein
MNSEIRLNVAGLVYNQSVVGTYGLVLAELEGSRRFSVMIGEPEAQSIAMKMNHKISPRPLTHDLIITLITSFGARMEKVVIYDMVNDVFYSELYLKKGDNTMVVDARTSDAIAIAVRAECPIFIREEILSIVGMEVDTSTKDSDDEDETEEKDINPEALTIEELVSLPMDELEDILETALKEEKYELAVNIRDAILRKKTA